MFKSIATDANIQKIRRRFAYAWGGFIFTTNCPCPSAPGVLKKQGYLLKILGVLKIFTIFAGRNHRGELR
jgi:hypothetical protein